jgi:hypothetical protein
MIESKITEQNFLQIAMHNYDNLNCTSLVEFEEDLKRFRYIKKLFVRYKETGIIKERLIINHLIILHNIFGVATTELLFFKIDKQYWDILATFLLYLNQMPEEIPEFGIKLVNMHLDPVIIDVLRKI